MNPGRFVRLEAIRLEASRLMPEEGLTSSYLKNAVGACQAGLATCDSALAVRGSGDEAASTRGN